MITLKNISKSYGRDKIVDKLSLNIANGTVFGFLGPNGAGKTTTIKMLVGISTPTEGKIEIDKNDISDTKNRSTIGFMPEDPYFYDHLTATEFLEFMASLGSPHPLSSRPKWRDLKISPTASRGRNDSNKKIQQPQNSTSSLPLAIIDKLLNTVGLKDSSNQPIANFSKGMKQRLGLAQALVNDPAYIFLDEPLDGLDPIGRREFKAIILNLKKQGKTIFFNSHVLSDVEEICDQIGIINKGKLIYAGKVKDFCKGKSLEERFVETIEASIQANRQ